MREPIYLGDEPIMGTLEDLDEGYDPNYTGLSDFQK